MAPPQQHESPSQLASQTYVIIVAVTEIEEAELPQAREAAFRFLRFVLAEHKLAGSKRQGVPPQNVLLFGKCFASETSVRILKDLSLRLDQIHSASRTDIFTTFQHLDAKWPDARHSTLMLFWVGHGFEGASGERRLVYEDFSDDNPVNLDVRKLLALWRRSFGTVFTNQLGFIDCCARESAGTLLNDDFPEHAASPLQASQEVFFGSANGDLAADGAFSNALIDQVLEDLQPGEWPPGQSSDLWAKIASINLPGATAVRVVMESDTGGVTYKWILGTRTLQIWGWSACALIVLIACFPVPWLLRVAGVNETLPKVLAITVPLSVAAYKLIAPARTPLLRAMYWTRTLVWNPAVSLVLLVIAAGTMYLQWTVPVAQISNPGTKPMRVAANDEPASPLRSIALVPPGPSKSVVADFDINLCRKTHKWVLQVSGRPAHCVQPTPAPLVAIRESLGELQLPVSPEDTSPPPVVLAVESVSAGVSYARLRIVSVDEIPLRTEVFARPGNRIIIAGAAVDETREGEKLDCREPGSTCLVWTAVNCHRSRQPQGVIYQILEAGPFTPVSSGENYRAVGNELRIKVPISAKSQ